MNWLFVVGGISGFVVGWLVLVFNRLVLKRNRVKNGWSDIDVQLKKRHDLIPSLVGAVQGYQRYEAGVLENVTIARQAAVNTRSQSVGTIALAENQLTAALHTLLVSVEAYPDLKASASFGKLQDQLVSVENDLESARRYYNATVREFNNTIQAFPTVLVAEKFGFKAAAFFEAGSGEREAVAVAV